MDDYLPLKQHVREYAEKYPDVVLVEQLCDFRELSRQFEYGETDIAITHNFTVSDGKTVQCRYVSEYTLHLAIAADHPLAGDGMPPPERLAELTFYAVTQVNEEESKARIFRRCGDLGFVPRRVELLDNFPTLLHMLREKRGASICAQFHTAAGGEEIRYYPLALRGDNAAYIVVAWHADRLTKPARDFIRMLPEDVRNQT